MPKGIYKRTKEHNRKNSEAHLGKKHSEKSKRKISEALKKTHQKRPTWGFQKGHKMPQKWREKLRQIVSAL